MSSLETEIYNIKLDIMSLEMLETYVDPNSFIIYLDLCTIGILLSSIEIPFSGPKEPGSYGSQTMN